MTASETEYDTPVAEQNLTTLVSGIVADTQTLLRQQVTLLRSELKDEIQRTTEAATYLGIGTALASVGGLFLVVGVVQLILWLAPTFPAWAAWGCVGGTLLIIGLIATAVGRARFRTVRAIPEKSLSALQENLTWKTTSQPK